MFVPDLPAHEGLWLRSRLRARSLPLPHMQMWEWGWLMLMGVAAASSATFLNRSLGIPGHAILRIVFPMTLGLALVPRHGGGILMSASAMGTTALYAVSGIAILKVFRPSVTTVALNTRSLPSQPPL